MKKNPPRLGIIGGTGLGEVFALEAQGTIHDLDTPFGIPSGPIITCEWHSVPVAFLARHGKGHRLNPSSVNYRANIHALKQLGVTHILASGACGSLAEDIQPRHLVVPDQVIDKTFKRPNSFFDGELAVHVDFAYPFCEKLRQLLLAAAGAVDPPVHPGGTYVCVEGPQFSTRAESLLHRSWGAHLVGMTCMPEAKLAREAEICYALVALVTDYDCWKPHPGYIDAHALMREIVSHVHAATEKAVNLITLAAEQAGPLLETACDHHQALETGLWTDKNEITDSMLEKLDLFIGKYVY